MSGPPELEADPQAATRPAASTPVRWIRIINHRRYPVAPGPESVPYGHVPQGQFSVLNRSRPGRTAAHETRIAARTSTSPDTLTEVPPTGLRRWVCIPLSESTTRDLRALPQKRRCPGSGLPPPSASGTRSCSGAHESNPQELPRNQQRWRWVAPQTIGIHRVRVRASSGPRRLGPADLVGKRSQRRRRTTRGRKKTIANLKTSRLREVPSSTCFAASKSSPPRTHGAGVRPTCTRPVGCNAAAGRRRTRGCWPA